MGKAMIPHLLMLCVRLTSRVTCNPHILRSSHENKFCISKHLWLI